MREVSGLTQRSGSPLIAVEDHHADTDDRERGRPKGVSCVRIGDVNVDVDSSSRLRVTGDVVGDTDRDLRIVGVFAARAHHDGRALYSRRGEQVALAGVAFQY